MFPLLSDAIGALQDVKDTDRVRQRVFGQRLYSRESRSNDRPEYKDNNKDNDGRAHEARQRQGQQRDGEGQGRFQGDRSGARREAACVFERSVREAVQDKAV